MTDNEIIMALELCGNEEDGNCAIRGCPLHSECKKDVHTLEKSALDLINRQKAEIERLTKAGEEAVNCFTRMETLYKIKCKELEVATSESIKEFSRRIESTLFMHPAQRRYYEEIKKEFIKE